jgi:hypothetical protein
MPSLFGRHYELHTTLKALVVGQGSVVGVATGYVLNGPEFELQWGQDILYTLRRALKSTRHLFQWVPSLFPEVKPLSIHLHPAPRLKKE